MSLKIAVMGSGGVGGYFGGRLLQGGSDVTFVARGAHLAALRKDGLKIESRVGDAHLKPVKAVENPADCGPVDVVMFCVKMRDTEDAARTIAPKARKARWGY